MTKKEEDRIVTEISHAFATFGGGKTSDRNPIAAWTSDKPLMFALGVDVREVVRFVARALREKPARKAKTS